MLFNELPKYGASLTIKTEIINTEDAYQKTSTRMGFISPTETGPIFKRLFFRKPMTDEVTGERYNIDTNEVSYVSSDGVKYTLYVENLDVVCERVDIIKRTITYTNLNTFIGSIPTRTGYTLMAELDDGTEFTFPTTATPVNSMRQLFSLTSTAFGQCMLVLIQ